MKILIAAIVTMLSASAFAVNLPKTVKELSDVTVMITNKDKRGGGSGVIYRSSNKASYVLTNSHVCEMLEKGGGWIITSSGEYTPERIKRSKQHDICLIEVISNLKVNTRLSAKNSELGDALKISGHPYLIPQTVTEGYLSRLVEITILVGSEKCTDKEREEHESLCYWFDGMPIIKSYQSYSTSVFIAPGNSGSGVFNAQGEIVGLAFAGIGRGISHGFIVPVEYMRIFVSNEVKTIKWVEVNAAKRMSELNASSERTTTRGYQVLTRDLLEKLAFPTIKTREMEQLTEKVEMCRKGTEKCNLK